MASEHLCTLAAFSPDLPTRRPTACSCLHVVHSYTLPLTLLRSSGCDLTRWVLHIKEAMRAAEKISTADFKVKVSLVASPLYVITTQTLDKDVGEAHFAPPVKPTDS